MTESATRLRNMFNDVKKNPLFIGQFHILPYICNVKKLNR